MRCVFEGHILWSILSSTNPGISIWLLKNVDFWKIVNLSFWLNHGIFIFSTTDGTESEEFSQWFSQLKYGRSCIWFALKQRNSIVLKSWSRAQIFLLRNCWDNMEIIGMFKTKICTSFDCPSWNNLEDDTSNIKRILIWFVASINHSYTYTYTLLTSTRITSTSSLMITEHIF